MDQQNLNQTQNQSQSLSQPVQTASVSSSKPPWGFGWMLTIALVFGFGGGYLITWQNLKRIGKEEVVKKFLIIGGLIFLLITFLVSIIPEKYQAAQASYYGFSLMFPFWFNYKYFKSWQKEHPNQSKFSWGILGWGFLGGIITLILAVFFFLLFSPADSSKNESTTETQQQNVSNLPDQEEKKVAEPTKNSASSSSKQTEYFKDIKFLNNQISVSFYYPYDVSVTKETENVFTLDKESMVGNESISYFGSKQELLSKNVYTKDSDGTLAGQGCFYNEESIESINNYQFKKLICYYNPILLTKSGKYSPDISSEIATSCVYELPNNRGVIFFTATVGQGFNMCNRLKEKYSQLQIKID